MALPSKSHAERWVKAGKPCTYRYGWAYRGAPARKITTEEAMRLLPKYSFGMGFYELKFTETKDGTVLEFNELSALDME